MNAHSSSQIITIVTGLPRSGTSLMMQMLEAAGVLPLVDGERPADPSNPRGYYELGVVMRTKKDAGWVDRATGKAVKVIHALLADLPRDRRYRVLFMERDLREVIASQDRMLGRLGLAASAISADRLALVFESQLDAARRLLKEEPCFELLAVSHQDLMTSARTTASDIEAFLGLRGVAEAMAACVDSALYRERWRSVD
jgi:hypothetical protein